VTNTNSNIIIFHAPPRWTLLAHSKRKPTHKPSRPAVKHVETVSYEAHVTQASLDGAQTKGLKEAIRATKMRRREPLLRKKLVDERWETTRQSYTLLDKLDLADHRIALEVSSNSYNRPDWTEQDECRVEGSSASFARSIVPFLTKPGSMFSIRHRLPESMPFQPDTTHITEDSASSVCSRDDRGSVCRWNCVCFI
jgi:hypothetical protein